MSLHLCWSAYCCIAAALVIGSAGCDSEPLNRRDDKPTKTTSQATETQPTTLETLDGVMYVEDDTQPTTTEYEELMGEPVLMGDIPMLEDYQSWD